MLPLETLGAFFVTAIVMGLAPGPDNIFVLTQSALYGFRAGIVTTLGLMTGLFGHTAAVALGVAALFQTSEMAFTVQMCIRDSLSPMSRVGLPAAVANAMPDVKKLAKFVTQKEGGCGAVREFVDLLLTCQGKREALLEHWMRLE